MVRLRALDNACIPLVEQWLNKEYVRRWFGKPERWLAEISGREKAFSWVHHYIAFEEKTPFGFCQYYTYAKWEGAKKWGVLPQGAAGIDFCIGEERFLGKGYGYRLVKAISDLACTDSAVKLLAADPDPANEASIRALHGNGYRPWPGTDLYTRSCLPSGKDPEA